MKKISTYHDIQLRITQKAHYGILISIDHCGPQQPEAGKRYIKVAFKMHYSDQSECATIVLFIQIRSDDWVAALPSQRRLQFINVLSMIFSCVFLLLLSISTIYLYCLLLFLNVYFIN